MVVGAPPEADVDAAAGHVGGHGHRPHPARLGNDRCLPLVVLGVEHLVGDALLAQQVAQMLGLLDRDRAHQHRLARLVAAGDVLDHGGELASLGHVHQVGLVEADGRLIRRDLEHLQPVDLLELGGLGQGRSRHPRQLLVHAEVVLEGDRGQGLVLLLDPYPLLGLDGLVQALGIPPALEDAAGELIDDLDLTVADHVVDVAVVQLLGPQRHVEVVDQVDVGVVVHVGDAEDLLDPGHPRLGGNDLALGLVHLVVEVAAQTLHDAGEVAVPLGHVGDPAADDQRGPGFVDEDRVDLIHDGEVVAPLHHVLGAHGHVVAQVVEAELVVGAVGQVGGVGRAALVGQHRGLDEPHRQAQEAVDAPHPFGVALGQVVVDRDHVHPEAAQGVEVDRHRGDQRLALAGLHLGDHAPVQGARPDDLDVEMALAQHPLRSLPHHCKGLGLDLVK